MIKIGTLKRPSISFFFTIGACFAILQAVANYEQQCIDALIYNKASLTQCSHCLHAKMEPSWMITPCCQKSICKHCIATALNEAPTQCPYCTDKNTFVTLAETVPQNFSELFPLDDAMQRIFDAALYADGVLSRTPVSLIAGIFTRTQREIFIKRLFAAHDGMAIINQLVSSNIISEFEFQVLCEPLIATMWLSDSSEELYLKGLKYLRETAGKEISTSMLNVVLNKLPPNRRKQTLEILHDTKKLPRSLYLSSSKDLVQNNISELLENQLIIDALNSYENKRGLAFFRLLGLIVLEGTSQNILTKQHEQELNSIRENSPQTLIEPICFFKILNFAKKWKIKKIGLIFTPKMLLSGSYRGTSAYGVLNNTTPGVPENSSLEFSSKREVAKSNPLDKLPLEIIESIIEYIGISGIEQTNTTILPTNSAHQN